MRIKQSFRRLEIDLLLIFPPPSSYHLSKQRLLERLWRRLRMGVTRRYDRVVQIRPCTTGETKCVQASGPQVRQATRLIAANYRGYRGSSSPLCASTTAFLVSFAALLRESCSRIHFQFRFQGSHRYIVLFISRFVFRFVCHLSLMRGYEFLGPC